jgi:hypothetical protein
MSDRTVPLDETAICGRCGQQVAYDFLGDFVCAKCCRALLPDDDADLKYKYARAVKALRAVRENLHCVKQAPHEYDADHRCDVCGHSTAYAKDVIDEVLTEIGEKREGETP